MPDDAYMESLRKNYERNKAYAKQGAYMTVLQPQQEALFRQWVAQNHVPFNLQDAVSDYDMRGFWSALQAHDPRAASAIDPYDQKIHYPDIWKTPYHVTFSAESEYAMPNAPHWVGSKLVDRTGKVIFDEAAQ